MGWNETYPRPQLRRDSFLAVSEGWTLNGREIRLPFSPQAPLSGFTDKAPEELDYRASFSLPVGFLPEGSRLMLNLGAVDQSCQVLVNGSTVCRHEGGYLPFSADITDALRPGPNELRVLAVDTLSTDYPYGKQSKKPHGMWYTPVSGIWQTVWLEAVPARGAVRSVEMTSGLEGVTFDVDTDAGSLRLTVPEAGIDVTSHDRSIAVTISDPRLWTPEDPYLYSYALETPTDRVEGYFALRTVTVEDRGGVTRLCLNGKPVFLHAVLDQGYFPGGHFLPADPSGYGEDVLRVKSLGFNALRKHVKIEPEEFYCACDRLGILVIQDMVNSGEYSFPRDTLLPTLGFTRRSDTGSAVSQRRRELFEGQAAGEIARLKNHPCVIGYTIFNEGWGQYNSDRLYTKFKSLDPTRFFISASGWFAGERSDADSRHVYFRSKVLKRARRGKFLILSECGGFSRRIQGHAAEDRKNYGYGKRLDSEEALTERIARLYEEMVLPSLENGLCGCVYTQLSDVEGETNGLYTFDRQVLKVNPRALREIAAQIRLRFANLAGG